MNAERDPCEDGLTPACFAARPKYARQMFSYRLLALLLGDILFKRLQTFIAVPLPLSPTETIGAKLSEVGALPGAGGMPPLYVSPWEPGPVHVTPQPEGALIMPTIRKAKINAAASGDNTLIDAVEGSKISIVSMAFTVADEVNITLKSGSTAISGAMDFGASGEPRGISYHAGDYPLQTTEGEAFVMNLSGAVLVAGFLTYYLE